MNQIQQALKFQQIITQLAEKLENRPTPEEIRETNIMKEIEDSLNEERPRSFSKSTRMISF